MLLMLGRGVREGELREVVDELGGGESVASIDVMPVTWLKRIAFCQSSGFNLRRNAAWRPCLSMGFLTGGGDSYM